MEDIDGESVRTKLDSVSVSVWQWLSSIALAFSDPFSFLSSLLLFVTLKAEVRS